MERFSEPEPTDKESGMSRRQFLFGAVSTAALGAYSYKLWREYHDEPRESLAPEQSIPPLPRPEHVADVPDAAIEAFHAEVAGYEAQSRLRHNEVMFVDDLGAPIGDPVPLQAIGDIDPGVTDEHGLFVEGVSGSWLRAARERLRRQYPDAAFTIDADQFLPRQMNLSATVARAVALEDQEPELVAGIQRGEIDRYVDIVRYFADKPVVGAEDMSRAAYVREAIVFGTHVPASLDQPLRDLMPGLCMQESGFNNDVTSRSGARGIWQFMPAVWEQDYDRSEADYNSLVTQTETAGEHFSRIVRGLQHFAGTDNLQVLRAHCADDAEYEHAVLLPLMINAYNAGARRMGEAVKQFIASKRSAEQLSELSSGYGLFKQISDFAYESDDGVLRAYGVEARAYTMQVIARARVLSEEYGYDR